MAHPTDTPIHQWRSRDTMNYQRFPLRTATRTLIGLALLVAHAATCSAYAQNSTPGQHVASHKVVYLSQYPDPRAKLKSYVSTVDSVATTDRNRLTTDDTLNRTTVLNIQTRPAGAEVVVDSTHEGVSPVSLGGISPGSHTIRCSLRHYREFTTEFVVDSGLQQTVIITLRPAFGVVSIETTPEDALVTIDNVHTTSPPLSNVQLSEGPHPVAIAHPEYGTPIQGLLQIFPGYRTVVVAGEKRFDGGTLLNSLFLPGVGQILDHSYLKGTLELLLGLGSGYLVYDSYTSRNDKQSAFELAKTKYQIAANETEAMVAHTNMSLAATELDRANDHLKMAYALLGAAYAISYIDALLFHSFRREITILGNYKLTYPELMEYHRNGSIQLGAVIHF
jgi:hypothetical protein